ncbi:OmpA family protein [Aquimarina agarivorans]|uniref:OmpA family protein n=1 Tax=Aquimarina agarivorans TaxID=980584 RepID=UPI000248EA10|nr:OmpA family protein [Aquimarina agarivorans]
MKSNYNRLQLFLCVLTFIVGVFSISSQERKTKYADKLFKSLKYKEASAAYERLFDKGIETMTLYENVADSYYYNTDMRNASKWYQRLVETYKDDVPAEYYFRYAHSLQGIGKNKEAKKWMKKFSKTTTIDDQRKKNYLQAKNELDKILSLNSNYYVSNVSTNTKFSDFGVGYYGDEVIFASAASENENAEKYYWNDQPYLNLYKGFTNNDLSDIEESKLLSNELNTKYHESNAVFTKDLKKVFFTRNNYKRRLGGDGNGVNHLKLYSAELKDDVVGKRWTNVKELPFNSDNYSVGHPALSDDETKLYFTSDMPGSIGSTDIFVVNIIDKDTYSKPRNLGSEINTSGREMFPFVMDKVLYFSSDGHLGFGGLDMFKSNLVNEIFQFPTNMGKPVNSPKDDFAFVFKKESNSGFLSSNRSGGKGDDDIYAVIPVKKETKCKQGVKGIVTNIVSQERINNATLELYNELGNKIATTTSNEIGQYNFDTILDCNTRYEVKVAKQGFRSVIKPTLTESVIGLTYLPLAVETLDELIVEEKGILKLKIGIIYFDLDKDFIRNDASIELNKIVLVMSQYPKMHIKIESHTDSRMPFDYNENLSDRRAKNTREYLISQGIEASRIESAIGYGEKQLINRCADGVPCSDSEHQLNRRSEFIITAM